MRALSAVIFACLIGIPAHDAIAADASDADAVAIDAGRLVVMVDQSADALKLLAPGVKDDDASRESMQSGPVFPELVYAVRRYNIVAGEACRAGVVDPRLCADPYRPAWLKDPPDADRSDAALRAMIDDTTAHLEPFRSDICARARRLTKDEAFCQLE
ncbi:MAG: hypothetical protein ABSA49_16145 [Rhizomicrobium sp.]